MSTDPEMRPIKPELSADQSVQDRQDLAALGHEQVLSRKFDTWSLLSLAFCVLGTWSTFAQDLSSGLSTGGPITILWGLVLVTACNICVALSLGEICSSMPTALGQAYWVARLWDTPSGRFVSYMCAWITTFGWWTLTASQVAFMADFLLGMKVMFDINWAGADEGWLEFVVYIGVVIVLTVINAISCRKEAVLPWLNYFVGVWFVGLFVVFIMALPIAVGTKAELTFQSAAFALGEWINPSDWPDGVIWFTGLVQAAYGLTAFDSVIHMVEEIPAPRKNAPKVMYLALVFGAVSGFAFMVVCLFCIQDVNKVIDSPSGLPFVELVQETVGLEGGAVLIALFIFSGLGQGISIMTTASRLTWGFARDGGLPFNRYLNHIDSVWQAPVRALWFQGIVIGLVGILYLFASTVLDAILSVSTIALTISYALPITALLTVGREKLPPGRFCLGRWGVPLNLVSIAYCCVTTVFFFFPASSKPPPADMNYAIAVFGVMLVIAIAFWFIQGDRTYLKTEGAINELAIAEQVTNGTIMEEEEPKAEGDK